MPIGVDEQTMRSIAREFNQSETTFFMASTRSEVACRLRSFTPAGVEVGGAGHNALGAWWWLATSGRLPLDDGPNRFLQEIGGRVLPVDVTAESGHLRAIAMEQEPPRWGDRVGDRTSWQRRWAYPPTSSATILPRRSFRPERSTCSSKLEPAPRRQRGSG